MSPNNDINIHLFQIDQRSPVTSPALGTLSGFGRPKRCTLPLTTPLSLLRDMKSAFKAMPYLSAKTHLSRFHDSFFDISLPILPHLMTSSSTVFCRTKHPRLPPSISKVQMKRRIGFFLSVFSDLHTWHTICWKYIRRLSTKRPNIPNLMIRLTERPNRASFKT